MFKTIMAPVDLTHVDRLKRAMQVTADLAKHYGAEVCYVAVTAPAPSSVAHNPAEFAAKLDEFARAQAQSHGHKARSHAMVSHDPAIDLDDTLLEAREEVGADLIVMASHVPGIKEYLLPSHGGRIASHAGVSVMVVREKD